MGVTIRREKNELRVKFSYSKERFELIRQFKGSRFCSETREWRLPLPLLTSLLSDPLFAPPTAQYQFEYGSLLDELLEAERKKNDAFARIQASPFFASEEDIADAELDVVFRLATNSSGIRAQLISSRKSIKKLFDTSPHVSLVKKEKRWWVSAAHLPSLLKELRDNRVRFAVEKSLGERLKESSQSRAALVAAGQGTGEEFRDALLVPFLDFEAGVFRVEGATTEQAAILLPALETAPERRKKLTSLHFEDIGALLSAANKGLVKLYRTASASDALAALAAQGGDELQEGFDERELGLKRPSVALVEHDGGGALIIQKGSHEELLVSSLETLSIFDSLSSYPYLDGYSHICAPGWKLSRLYRIVNEYFETRRVSVPRSRQFLSVLADSEKRESLIERRNYYQALSDVHAGLTNKTLESELFPHQRVAVKWLLETPAAFLGDDMGLGKTLSVLAVVEELLDREEVTFLIIACPNSLIRNWQREAERWTPTIDLKRLPQGKSERAKFLQSLMSGEETCRGLVINYELLRLEDVYQPLFDLCGERATLLCLDESQRVKNPMSKAFNALRTLSLRAQRRILLSGTPTPRELSDIWGQIHILDHGERFGSDYYKWLSEVAELGTKYSKVGVKRYLPHKVEDTIARVHELLLRRKKEDVVDLPEKIFAVRDVELESDQQSRYDEVRKELLVRVTSMGGDASHKAISSIMEEYLRAVQIASNPRLVDPEWKGTPSKFKELDEIIDELLAREDEKVVVWTNYLKNVDELVERYAPYRTAAFTGAVKVSERAEIVKNFQSDSKEGPRVLVAIPAAGGVGITLTRARTAVYVDKTWNAEHWLQSIDRIHRIGQKQTSYIISLHGCKVDDMIAGNLRKKEKMQRLLLEGSMDDSALLPTREELLQALSPSR